MKVKNLIKIESSNAFGKIIIPVGSLLEVELFGECYEGEYFGNYYSSAIENFQVMEVVEIMSIEKLIKLLCDSSEAEMKTPDTKLYRGSIHNVDMCGDSGTLELILVKIPDFKLLEAESYINLTYKNDSEMVTVSYCEGDICIIVCSTLEAYDNEVKETIEFYNNL